MSDEMKVGASANSGQQVGQVDGENYEKKKAELEQQQLTQGLAGEKKKDSVDDETVSVTVLNGESISKIAKKYGVSVQEIMDLNQKQLKYFKSATDCDGEKVAGFLVGATIKLPSKANMKAVEENLKTTAEQERKKYEDSMKNLDTKLCDDRTQSYKVMDENFRKEHNIRTKGEYEAGKDAGGTSEAEDTPAPKADEKDAPKTDKENPKGADETPEMTDEEFRKEYPYIARPEEKETPSTEPPKWELPQFKPDVPWTKEQGEEEIQIPLRPKDEGVETPAAPKAQETPKAEKEDPNYKVPDRPTPLAPDENTPAYEAPTWEVPQFKPDIPGMNEPEDDIQVPLRPKDEVGEAPAAQKQETPKAAAKQDTQEETPKTGAEEEVQDDSELSPYIKRPDDEVQANETPSFEAPSFVPDKKTVAQADTTKTETKNEMPTIQEMADEAKKRRDADKPWWKFW